jgi:hypothetical protein
VRPAELLLARAEAAAAPDRPHRPMVPSETDVVWALVGPGHNRSVVGWLDGQPAQSIWRSSITALAVCADLWLLEPGRRRSRLERAFQRPLAASAI